MTTCEITNGKKKADLTKRMPVTVWFSSSASPRPIGTASRNSTSQIRLFFSAVRKSGSLYSST